MSKARRRDEVARLEAELEDARPFLGVAREIQEDMARIAADPTAPVESIAEVLDAIPARERVAAAREAFERLDPLDQWGVLAEVFGDEDIQAALTEIYDARRHDLHRYQVLEEIARGARTEHRLDTQAVPEHALVTLGLFREPDVGVAVGRGRASSACARRVVLRRDTEPGVFLVVEDVFNPAGSYFVTGAYDGATWEAERLEPHASVRVGTIRTTDDDRTFEPVLHAGGRVDLELAGQLVEGRLHLGYLIIESLDLFGQGGHTE